MNIVHSIRRFFIRLFSTEKKIDQKLKEIDRNLSQNNSLDVPPLFADVSLDEFGELLLDVPQSYPSIKKIFPSMPPDDIQDKWTGNHGNVLLVTSLAFVKSLISGYTDLTGKKIQNATVLDYGCGWGRLIRLLYKVIPYENIYGVDPWDKSIELCRQYGIKANLAVSDYVPSKLPFEQRFDLVFAFSVFTHLSEKTANVVLSTLRKYISSDGLLVITIRPKEYWSFHQQGKFKEEMFRLHDERGFAFNPHNREPIDGDITYGDASISLGYIEKNFPQWELARVITNRIDRYQTILFLRPK